MQKNGLYVDMNLARFGFHLSLSALAIRDKHTNFLFSSYFFS